MFALAPIFAVVLVLAAPPVEVRLAESASVPGTRILLSDVVAPEARASLPQDLASLDLGRAPCPGYARSISRESLGEMLPSDRVRLVGPAAISIASDARGVTTDELVEAARKYIGESLRFAGGTEIALERPPLEVRVPRGRSGIELSPRLSGRAADRGPLNVCIDVKVDGMLQAVVPVAFKARTFAEIPVATRDLAKGETLTSADVVRQRVETTDMPRAAVEALPLGQIARIAIVRGRTIRAQDFEPALMVRRNDAVTIRFTKGRLIAETFGIARDSGSAGAAVRVENLVTKKVVTGRVTAPGIVAVGN